MKRGSAARPPSPSDQEAKEAALEELYTAKYMLERGDEPEAPLGCVIAAIKALEGMAK